jgi:hypothetical protein
MMLSELEKLGGYPCSGPDEVVIVRYKPKTRVEARELCQSMTLLLDATSANPEPRWYAGFANDDLLDGKPGVVVSKK